MKRKIRIENMNLSSQLTYLTLAALIISMLVFNVILRAVLLPFYEENIYTYLKQPASNIGIDNNKLNSDCAFVIQTKNGATIVSNNFDKLFKDTSVEKVLKNVKETQGKFNIGINTYYYSVGYTSSDRVQTGRNIIFTDDTLIRNQRNNLNRIIFPTMIITILILTAILFTWSKYIVNKIKILKKKTENIDNDNFIHEQDFKEFMVDDELNMLNLSIEKTRKNLKTKEEYKNLMFQNLSHELKTPISVIKSYIEGIQDEVIDEKEALPIILEETDRLSNQVQTILHFNKIDYMKEMSTYKNSKVNLIPLIEKSINKFKVQRQEIKWNLEVQENLTEYIGTEDMWQKVIDNILSNFERYAKENIKIIVKDNYLEFENDGEKIPEELIKNIFLPYSKGPKGQTGLGLGVVKSTVNLFGYEIKAENENNSVKFVIYKQTKMI